jgi:hypothetical protein
MKVVMEVKNKDKSEEDLLAITKEMNLLYVHPRRASFEK